ncbi:MAG: polysaccharide biosynthesis protein [Aliifodinibius sp.]|nr:polysaccharide biosynthesis protein [Fodinibius sp.]NIY27721.1 polysaccharide biosynthesis protein [Fodinibius sp.]
MTVQQWLTERLQIHTTGSRRRLLKVLVDAVFIVLAYFCAFQIRFEGAIPKAELKCFVQSQPLLLAFTLVSFYKFKLYKGLYEYSSIKDLLLLITAHSLGWAVFVVVQYLLHLHWTPRSVLIIYWLLGLILMGGVRFSYRLFFEFSGFRRNNQIRVLVIGAGAVGEMIIRQMKLDSQLGYRPVCLVDDDPEKRDISIHGVPVVGTINDIPSLVKQKNISQIIIATSTANAGQMRRIVSICEKAEIVFKTVPGPREMMNGTVRLDQLRGVRIEDLLEREPVRTDGERIAEFLNGKVVLVTGAGGSIGQELSRQIMGYKPEKLVLLDRNENSLFYLEDDLKSRWVGGYEAVVGDVCDVDKVRKVFTDYRPSVVFHAAAHKHVPLMELNPEEAIKNNLKGTITVANVARRHAVQHFVLISTDKAVEPINIMGASKRLAELYIQAINHQEGTRFITVRFGNVLGSNGSVVTLFQKQIAHRQAITVTDPKMTRYFMTVSEAIALILQASAIGDAGEIFVLDMGEPVRVVEMARHLISMSGLVPGKDIPIEFTGIRPGEKIYERLWYEGEHPKKTEFEKILVARTNGNNYGQLLTKLNEILKLAQGMQRNAMMKRIRELIPSYSPNGNGKVHARNNGKHTKLATDGCAE